MYPSIITLNANGLNAPTKIFRVAEWIRNQDPYIYMLPARHPPQIERYTQTKTKGLEKDISCKWLKKNLG